MTEHVPRSRTIRAVCAVRTPCVDSPVWADAIFEVGLVHYLSEPRTWTDLRAFAKVRRLDENALRNMLAYLDTHQRATCLFEDGVALWCSDWRAWRQRR